MTMPRTRIGALALASMTAALSMLLASHDVLARDAAGGLHGRGGAARSSPPPAGSGLNRQGVAASGSFSGRGQPSTGGSGATQSQTAAARSERQASRQSSAASTSAANQAQRQSAMASNQAQRQQASNENVASRQQGATTRQQSRQEACSSGSCTYTPRPGYPSGTVHYEADDGWDNGAAAAAGLVAGTMIGAAATAAATPPSTPPPSTTVVQTAPPAAAPVAGLPCSAEVVTAQGSTYYRCGQTYYMQAYGASGPVYMPVQPPAM